MTSVIIIIRTFITRKLIQNRKCARQQSKAEQISFQLTAKSGQSISQSQFSWKVVMFHELGPRWTVKDRDP